MRSPQLEVKIRKYIQMVSITLDPDLEEIYGMREDRTLGTNKIMKSGFKP
jgi:hypothetical protein